MYAASISSLALLWSVWIATASAADAPQSAGAARDEHVTAELLSEQTSLQPGARAWVALRLTHDPHWHTYWMNSGDSGLPTRLAWQLPPGFRAGEIAWPAPTRFELGGVYNFGYEGTILLPVPIDVPASAKPGTANLAVDARWVVCNDDLCIPGRGTYKIALPIKTQPAIANAETTPAFTLVRSQWPKAVKWTGSARAAGGSVQIELEGPDLPPAQSLDAFPTEAKLLKNVPMKFSRTGDRLIVTAVRSEYFEKAPAKLGLVLTQRGATQPLRSWQVEVPWIDGNTSKPAAVK